MKSKLALLIANGILLSASAQRLSPAPSVEIVKLKPPNYPPIAVAARVSGEVNLEIRLLQNGAAGEVQVKSGPQMLREAAVESARMSVFQTAGIQNGSGLYGLVYKFVLDPTSCSEARDSSYPHVSYDSSTVTISVKPIPICDPAADVKVRSAKCLFLWKCRLRTP
jgi:hypothetical protein